MTNSNSNSFLATQDRHVRQCTKEARVVAVIWFVGLVWCCGVIGAWGYPSAAERPEEVSLVWGVPAWVMWGLFVPWLAMIAASWWFAIFVLKDDEPLVDIPSNSVSAE